MPATGRTQSVGLVLVERRAAIGQTPLEVRRRPIIRRALSTASCTTLIASILRATACDEPDQDHCDERRPDPECGGVTREGRGRAQEG
jgi:hypothetical protein